MAGTPEDLIMSERNILAKALQKLDEKSFAQFKTKLSSWNVRKKYERIPSVLLEDADPQAVADLISHFYGAVYGIKLTQAILDALNEKKVREELLRDSEGGWGHVIDEHTSDLIRMNIRIDPILYYLHHMKLLTDDQYGELTKQPTTREKVEGLLEIARCWDDAGKDKIWQALECYHSEDMQKMLDDSREKNKVAIPWRNMTIMVDKNRSLYRRKAPRSPAPGSARKNFVEQYEEKLINQITMVDPVLDDLRDQKLLTTKQHKKLSSKLTCQEKMTSLCDTVRSWSDLKKDRVYQALKKYSYGIIRHLEEGEKTWFPRKIASYFKNHFVDGNRDALIKQIKNVDPVLCDLRDQQLLTERQFAKLMEKPSHEEKMRSLFDTTHSWSYTNKDKVYDALRRHNYEELRSMEMGYIPELSSGPDISPPDYLYKYGLPMDSSVKIAPQQFDSRKSWDKNTFLDSHWSELIRNVQFVDPVLFDLRDEMLLAKEKFKDLFNLSSSMDKMHELFILANSWNYTERARLLDVLGKYNEDILRKYKSWLFQKQFFTNICDSNGTRHFVDEHESVLVKEITDVNFIVNDLLVKDLLSQGEYNAIRRKNSPQAKMKQLYYYSILWDEEDKDVFLDILKKHYPKLIMDLKSGKYKSSEEEGEQSSTNLGGDTFKQEKAHGSSYSHVNNMDCELCGKKQDPDDVLVVPKIQENTYRLDLKSAGRFLCSEMGIKFQVTGPVTIEYELDSWYNYMEFLKREGSEVLGPLFSIKTPIEPNTVSAVYLPHYLCLKKLAGDASWIRCAHFQNGNLIVETPTKVLPYHILLENPSFSSLGAFCLKFLPSAVAQYIPLHGKVHLYNRVVGKKCREYKIHLYLLPDFAPISKEFKEEKRRGGFQKIDKPPRTTTVYSKTNYTVNGPEEAYISPQVLEVLCISPLDSYTEITITAKKRMFDLSVMQPEDQYTIWRCRLTEGEVEELLQETPDKQSAANFLQIHREALIQGVSLVDPILDVLLEESLLTNEHYDRIREIRTSQDKMRELFRCTRGWGDEHQERFYRALKQRNAPLIQTLEG